MYSKSSSLLIVFSLLLVSSFGISTPSRAATPQGIRILAQDAHGLTAELTLPPFETKQVQGPDGSYQSVRVCGWASTHETGFPELPITGILIQVPDGGMIHSEILEARYETLPERRIYPVAASTVSESGEQATVFARDENAYRSTDFYPDTLIRISSRDILRSVPVVRVLIAPFQWNASSGELRCYKRIRFKLTFDEPLPAQGLAADGREMKSAAVAPYEDLLKGCLVNYRLPAQGSRVAAAAPVFPPQVQNDSLRIEIKTDGIYRLTYYDLKARLPLDTIDPATFQLFNKSGEIAVKVVSTGGNRFAAGSFIEFYAQGLNNTFTDTNVYWLCWGKQPGKRVASLDGRVAGGVKSSASFYDTLHFEENHVIWEWTPGAPEQDYWFWERLTAPATGTYSVSVPSPVPNPSKGVLRVALRGYTTAAPHPDHHTKISLNGTLVGDAFWDGDSESVQEMQVPAGLIHEGPNTVSVELPGDTGAVIDTIYTNWIELDYRRRFVAVDDLLKFAVSGTVQVQVANLSNRNILIYDITNPRTPRNITGFKVGPDGSGYKATFETRATGMRKYCVAAGPRKPDSFRIWKPANLRSRDNAADFILITPREFLGAVQPLVKRRANQGLRVKGVAVEDIYNEFSDGLFDPAAIKAFLTYAYKSWGRPAPSYVLLVGDANSDYRDYFGAHKKTRVPVHLTFSNRPGLTPDDNWYVCVAGNDDLPDMMIGRIPGADSKAVAALVRKIIGYENSATYNPRSALFVADNDDPHFEYIDEKLIGYLPSAFSSRKVYLRSYADPAAATQDILSTIDDGMLMTTYAGHGAAFTWGKEKFLQPSDVSLLNNGDRLTFLLTLDCWNGYFSQPYAYSLGEAFVVPPDKGAVATFAPSGMSETWEQEVLGSALFSALFDKGETLLGILTTQSKIATYAQGTPESVLSIYTLIGDPACRLKDGK